MKYAALKNLNSLWLILVFVFVYLFIIPMTDVHAAYMWESVGTSGFTSDYANDVVMAFDSHDMPYVASVVSNNNISVMKFDGSNWVNVGSLITGYSTPRSLNMAIGPDDKPNIVFRDDSTRKPVAMKFDGTNWVTIGSPNFSPGRASYTTIAIDSTNTPYVAFENYDNPGTNNYWAMVMKFDGTAWVTVGESQVSMGNTYFTSIAIDHSDIIYLGFRDGANDGKATVKKFNGSSWMTLGIAGFSDGEIWYLEMEIGSSDQPYVSYMDRANGDKATVMKFNGSSWEEVGTAGFSAGAVQEPSLAISGCGIPYVAYSDMTLDQKATVMKFNGTTWDAVGVSGFTPQGIGAADVQAHSDETPYVAFVDSSLENKVTVMRYLDVTLTNAEAPTITEQPADASVDAGQPVNLIVEANVTSGTLSYQWYSNTTNSSTGGTLISGATSNSYDPPTSTAGTTYYYCVITNTDTSVNGDQTTDVSSRVSQVIVQAAASPTPILTQAPTPVPTQAPTPVPTTEADENIPATGETGDSAQGSIFAGLVLIVLALAIVILQKKHSKT